MLRISRPLLAPARAAAARNDRVVSWVARPSTPSLSRKTTSQSHPAHAGIPTRPSLFLAQQTPPSKLHLVAYSTKPRPPVEPKIDRDYEKKLAQEKLKPRPGEVTVESSRRHLTEPYETKDKESPVRDTIMTDVNKVQDALSLTTVPRETYALGLGGTIPYFITSLSTVYLGWNLRHSYPTSSTIQNSFMVSHETATQWLQMLEPIQLGYGAVIISFLGAIHWGMEINEKTPSPDRTRFRHMMGFLAPAVAWPTLLLPVHFALTGQFLAFTLLYFADSKATKMGWAPPWYSTYRFVLTLVAGSAILISLIFRAKIDDAGENMNKRIQNRMHQRMPIEEDYTEKWAKLENEEKAKRKKEEEEEKKKAKKDGKQKSSGEGEDGEKEEEGDKSEGEGEGTEGDEKGDEGGDDSGKDGDNEDANKDKDKDSGKSKEKDADESGNDGGGDNSKGDEKKDAVDGDSSSKKKASKGDEKSKDKGGKAGK